nr:MAG TPA: putative lipoprotein [Caudoviricetes sp.]
MESYIILKKSFFAFNCSHCSPCLFSILNHKDKW